MAAPSERLIPIPEGVSFELAAGGLMQGMTAQHLCYEAVPVATDAVVLVHSAGSGVGRMLTQLATRGGARVIATVSKSHKARSASDAGAWRVLVRDEIYDLGAAIWELTDGEGVDIAFDGTGKTLFDVSVSVLRFNGVFATYGFAGGRIPPIDLGEQRLRRASCPLQQLSSHRVDRSATPARRAGPAVDRRQNSGCPRRSHLSPPRRRCGAP